MKNALRIALIIVLVAVFAVGATACSKTDKYASFFLTVNDNGTFRILQLTDIHLIDSTGPNYGVLTNYTLRDEWAMECVRTLVEETQPDFIMVTGDSIFNVESATLLVDISTDNEKTFKKFAKFIDSFDIPWGFVFGNHDEEGLLKDQMKGDKEATKKELSSFLLSDEIENCLYADGPDDINGVGNYIINVENEDGTLNNALVMFDSGSYLGIEEHLYECVHDDQLKWYEKAIKHLRFRYKENDIKSIVFQHIPFKEYREALELVMGGVEVQGKNWQEVIKSDGSGTPLTLEVAGETVTYHGGVYNDGEICSSYIGWWEGDYYDGGHEFDKLLEVGSTQAVFCGHDHRNTFSITYKGIRLTYGMSVDYSANGLLGAWFDNQEIYNETAQRGGTLITLNADSSISVEQVPFTRNLYQEALAQQQ